MSSADLYEDGFPHGTKEGYDRGCRGSACPGALEAGQTCATAKSRYNGDYHYRKAVDAGMTPEEIHAAEKPATTAATKSLRLVEPKAEPLRLVDAKPIARPKLPAPTPVAAELEQWPDDEPDLRNATADVTVDPTTGKTIPLDLHGTHKGYWKGCRDIACPGVAAVGKSCRAALNEYTRDKKRERLERAAAAEPAEPAAPAAAEGPAIEATPELTAEELVKVEAFGLHEPEHDEPAPLDEWEHDLLHVVNDEFARTTDELDALAADPRQPTDYADDILERDAKIAELERKLRWFEDNSKQPAPAEPQQLAADGGRTIKISLVGEYCEITVGPAS